MNHLCLSYWGSTEFIFHCTRLKMLTDEIQENCKIFSFCFISLNNLLDLHKTVKIVHRTGIVLMCRIFKPVLLVYGQGETFLDCTWCLLYTCMYLQKASIDYHESLCPSVENETKTKTGLVGRNIVCQKHYVFLKHCRISLCFYLQLLDMNLVCSKHCTSKK